MSRTTIIGSMMCMLTMGVAKTPAIEADRKDDTNKNLMVTAQQLQSSNIDDRRRAYQTILSYHREWTDAAVRTLRSEKATGKSRKIAARILTEMKTLSE